MGWFRDLLKWLGLASSAGSTISSSGEKLLNIRNDMIKVGEDAKKRKKAEREARRKRK